MLSTRFGREIEASGRPVGGRAVLRLRDVSSVVRDLTALRAEHQRLQHDLEAASSLIEALPSPVWMRD